MRKIYISIVRIFQVGIAMLMLGTGYVMAQVDVSLPNITRPFGAPNEVIDVTVENVTFSSFQFDVLYDTSVVYITGASTSGTFAEGGLLVANADTLNGKLSVAYANGSAVTGSGSLIKLTLKFRNNGSTPLDFNGTFKFNAGTPVANEIDGMVTIPAIAVSFPNLTATVGDTVDIAISTTSIDAGNNVFSYQFVANFNEEVINVISVVSTGTLSAGGLVSSNINNTAGTVSVAYANSEAVSGSGTLIILRAVVVGAGTSDNSFASFMYNAGSPSAGTVGGQLIASDIQTFSISGSVTYNNSTNPVVDALVTLSGDASEVDTIDGTGDYSFEGLVAGNYNVSVDKTDDWGGVNATDALLAQRYFLGTSELDSLQQLAADVNNSGAVNNTDALEILRRYVEVIDQFDKPDWVFLPASSDVVLSDSDVVLNIEGQATGDVNASLIPGGLGKEMAVSLFEISSVNALAKESVEVPLRIGSEMNIAAASLKLSYSADVLKYEGIKAGGIQFQAKESNGVISLAWADLAGGGKNAVKLNADDVLVTLVFTAVNAGSASFKLDANSEFASEKGEVVKGSVSAPSVNVGSPSTFALEQNYPNPFNPSTKISYTIPEMGNVTLTIYNVAGQEVTKLVNNSQAAGSHEVTWKASNLSSGIYFYKLNFEGASRSFSDIKSMILLK